MIKKYAALIFILFSVPLSGQQYSSSDTLRIKEIFVKGSAVSSVVNGFRSSRVDSSVIKDHNLGNLSEIISEGTPLFVKSYGPSGVATISFRGTGASHTQLMWNDLSINSPMLGQADLSLIPGGFMDEIRVFSGGASMAAGNGGLGGLVTIDTKPEWQNGSSLVLNAGTGSFGRYSGLAKFRTGGEKFQSVTRAYFNSAKNDFPFINSFSYSEPVTEYRSNSEIMQSSVMQEFYIRGKKSVTTASTWFNYTDRNLPANILVPRESGSEYQVDHSLRTVIRHNRYLPKGGFESSFAWFNEYLRYVNNTASVDSRNQSNILFFKEVLQVPAGNRLDLKFKLIDELDMVNTVNYSGMKSRNLLTLSASARKEIGKQLGIVLLLREMVVEDKLMLPDYSAAVDFEILPGSGAFVKMNFSRNSKVPTMNDLFWNPGGNPDLRNEYSYNGELSTEIRHMVGIHSEFNSSLSLYAGRISDMIQWVPSEMSYWTPVNIASTATSGIETEIGYKFIRNKTVLKANVFYSFNHATSNDNSEYDGNQLIYVPENQLNGSLRWITGNYSAGISGSFTGKRYTSADNTEFLPGYTLFNLNTGYGFRAGSSRLDLTVRAENIFNEHYEVIAWYPMPGRSFLLTITCEFGKK